jgi:hypothetical protein
MILSKTHGIVSNSIDSEATSSILASDVRIGPIAWVDAPSDVKLFCAIDLRRI